MIATSLGSFVVNLGSVANVPVGEERVFQIGRQLITIVHRNQSELLAVEATHSRKTYPAAVSDTGDILVGIEGIWNK
jgi:hypothetical protein